MTLIGSLLQDTTQEYNRTVHSGRVPEGKTNTSLLTRIYLGIVKDTRDPQRMGRLTVCIPELGGDINLPENWVLCTYCSPFAGASFFDIKIHEDTEGTDAIKDLKLRAQKSGRIPDLKEGVTSGRQSYGMWFVPPDIGNEVLVAFLNGDPNRAVWFGCLYQQDTNHMVPGIAQKKIFAGEDSMNPDETGPVIEHDSRDGFNPDSPKRKAYTPLRDSLKLNQGLSADEERGQSTSSSTREAPSEVFGILTPNGNNFVMDDIPDQELIRLRTKGGVQLLLHQTSGFVYMISKDGKTWIELSNEGDVDIYGEGSISFHGEKFDVNMKAGQDVNIEAGKNINIRAKENIKIEAGGEVDFLAKKDLRITSSEKFSAKAEKEFAITAGDTIGITSDSDIFEQGSNIFMNTAPGPEADEATEIDSASSVTGPSTQTVAGFWQEGEPYEDKINIIPRVPQHEPWKDH